MECIYIYIWYGGLCLCVCVFDVCVCWTSLPLSVSASARCSLVSLWFTLSFVTRLGMWYAFDSISIFVNLCVCVSNPVFVSFCVVHFWSPRLCWSFNVWCPFGQFFCKCVVFWALPRPYCFCCGYGPGEYVVLIWWWVIDEWSNVIEQLFLVSISGVFLVITCLQHLLSLCTEILLEDICGSLKNVCRSSISRSTRKTSELADITMWSKVFFGVRFVIGETVTRGFGWFLSQSNNSRRRRGGLCIALSKLQHGVLTQNTHADKPNIRH